MLLLVVVCRALVFLSSFSRVDITPSCCYQGTKAVSVSRVGASPSYDLSVSRFGTSPSVALSLSRWGSTPSYELSIARVGSTPTVVVFTCSIYGVVWNESALSAVVVPQPSFLPWFVWLSFLATLVCSVGLCAYRFVGLCTSFFTTVLVSLFHSIRAALAFGLRGFVQLGLCLYFTVVIYCCLLGLKAIHFILFWDVLCVCFSACISACWYLGLRASLLGLLCVAVLGGLCALFIAGLCAVVIFRVLTILFFVFFTCLFTGLCISRVVREAYRDARGLLFFFGPMSCYHLGLWPCLFFGGSVALYLGFGAIIFGWHNFRLPTIRECLELCRCVNLSLGKMLFDRFFGLCGPWFVSGYHGICSLFCFVVDFFMPEFIPVLYADAISVIARSIRNKH